jgi:cytochrome c556
MNFALKKRNVEKFLEVISMIRKKRFTCAFSIALTFVWLTACADGPDDVDYRQNVMKTLGNQTNAVFAILQERVPGQDLSKHVQALAVTSTQILKAFESNSEGGNAKPEIWNDWDDFAAGAHKLATKLADLQRDIEAGIVDADQVKEAFTCKACHDTYRVDKKPEDAQSDAHDDDQNVIHYRRHIMKAMDAQTAALGQMLSLVIADDNFNSHLEVISINAEMTLSSFEKKVPGGEALPAVWENWDDFSEQMNAFTKGIATATQTAKEQGQNAAMGQIIDALSCKRCHDHYREKK